jgi:ribosomal protein S18 acetylase RimI-like enzyme
MDYVIQPLQREDEPILWEMLYQALQSEGSEIAASREVVHEPEFARYVEGWGREGDAGFSAHDSHDQQLLGAVWCRASMSDSEPELAFAVKPDHRRRGIGAALLTQWVRANPQQSSISLHVAPTSPAVRLYERFGFRIVAQGKNSVTMQREG